MCNMVFCYMYIVYIAEESENSWHAGENEKLPVYMYIYILIVTYTLRITYNI